MPFYEFECPACKKVIERLVPIGTKTYKSYCDSKGKDVRAKRILSPTPTTFVAAGGRKL